MMGKDFIYYTLQGDYTLDALERFGSYASEIDNNYKLIDLVKNEFKSKGIVYYFKVKKGVSKIPTSGRDRANLVYLNPETLSKNRIEFTGNKFPKALMMCDALCRNRFLRTEDIETSVFIEKLEELFEVNFEFFKNFGSGESDVYVGLVDTVNKIDVLEIVKDYRGVE
jgi:hypothetical protein